MTRTSPTRGRRKKNAGWFQPGYDPRRSSYRFTREDCQKGYAKALDVCIDRGWGTYAWFFRKVRGFYDEKRRTHGKAKERRARGVAADAA